MTTARPTGADQPNRPARTRVPAAGSGRFRRAAQVPGAGSGTAGQPLRLTRPTASGPRSSRPARN